MPLYNLATRRLEDTYPFITQVSKSSVNPDKWSFADGLGNPVYWFDGTASWAASSSGGTPATASHSLTTKAAGIEWDIQLNSASAINGILGVAELGRGYYNWNAGAWTFGNRITGSYSDLIGSWSFHTNKDNYAIGSYSIAHGYKNIAGDSADSVEGYFTSTVNDTVTSLNLNFLYDSIAGTITVLQPGDFTTELDALNLTNVNLKTWFYNAVDGILYPIYISAASVYDAGTDRTYFLISSNFASDDFTGNGVLYYQSFSSTIKGEPLANHAEGDHTIASGDASHAEGKYTWANAVGSHAEGLNTISSNSGSHAEGRNTQAKGDGSHAEGSDTIASGSSAHAEGYATLAQGEFSHAEGFYTIASGAASHAGGRETLASGYGARAIGYQTIASGEYSNAEGSGSVAIFDFSHAEGLGTVTGLLGQTAVGRYNILNNSDDYFVIGDGTVSVASNALGVNDSRFYASNSIYLPDLTDVFKPHILVFDTGSKRVFYYTGSGLGGGGGGPSNISFYNGNIGVLLTSAITGFYVTGSGITATNVSGLISMSFDGGGSDISFYSGSTQLTASLNSLVITGSGITASINNGQVTMSFNTGSISVLDESVLRTNNVKNLNFTGNGVSATNIGTSVTVTIPGIGPGQNPYLAYFNSTDNVVHNTIFYDSGINEYRAESNRFKVKKDNSTLVSNDYESNLDANNFAPAGGRISMGGSSATLIKSIGSSAYTFVYGVIIDYTLAYVPDPNIITSIYNFVDTGTIHLAVHGSPTGKLFTVQNPLSNWSVYGFSAVQISLNPSANLNASEQWVFAPPSQNVHSVKYQFGYEVDISRNINVYFLNVTGTDIVMTHTSKILWLD